MKLFAVSVLPARVRVETRGVDTIQIRLRARQRGTDPSFQIPFGIRRRRLQQRRRFGRLLFRLRRLDRRCSVFGGSVLGGSVRGAWGAVGRKRGDGVRAGSSGSGIGCGVSTSIGSTSRGGTAGTSSGRTLEQRLRVRAMAGRRIRDKAARQKGKKAERGRKAELPSCPALLRRPAHALCVYALRQEHAERRSAAWRRLHLDVAVVHLHRTVDHREADAAAFFFRREIQIEDSLQVLRFDPDAGVGERDQHTAARAAEHWILSVPPFGIAWQALSARLRNAWRSIVGSP